MKLRRMTIQVSIALILLHLFLPTCLPPAVRAQSAKADIEQNVLPIVWGLPVQLVQHIDQMIDSCVRAAFAVSQQSEQFNGTLTYTTDGDVAYQTTPRDRLRVIDANGVQVDFWITDLQGYTADGPDAFLGDDYILGCRAQTVEIGDLAVAAEQTSDGMFNRTRLTQVVGTLVYAAQNYAVDANVVNDIYFESSFGGSEYRNQAQLLGDVNSAGLTLSLNESFTFQQVTLDDESAAASWRVTNNQWQAAGNRYAIDNGFLNQSYKDGSPSRLETEWRAGGAILRNARPWGKVTGQLAGAQFEVRATLPTGTVLLAGIPLSNVTPASAPTNRSTQAQASARALPLEIETVLKADVAERTQLATQIYQLVGLDEESAQAIVSIVGVEDDMMVALVVIASRFYNLDHKYNQALTLLEKTFAELGEIPLTAAERAEYERTLHNELGKTNYYLGSTDSALDHLQQALDGYRAVKDEEGQAVALANRALILQDRADYEAALADSLEALELQNRVIRRAAGDSGGSLHDQLALFRAPFNLGALNSNIGSLFHTLGENAKAEAAYLEALKIDREAEDRSGEAAVLHNLGRLYTDLGLAETDLELVDTAIMTLTTALEIVQTTTGNPLAAAHILSALGAAYEGQEKYDQALEQYDAALENFRQIGNRAGIGYVLNSIATVHLRRYAFTEAAPLLKEAAEIYASLGYPADQSAVLSNVGYLQERLGDVDQALTSYREAVDLIESVQGQLQVAAVKSAYLATQSDVYAQLVNLLWQAGEAKEAFAYAERARARALLDQLGNVRATIQWRTDSPIVNQAETARRHLINLQNALDGERAKSSDQQNQARIDSLGEQLTGARDEYAELMTRLQLVSPEYASLVQIDTLPPETIQRNILDANTTLLEYFVSGERTLAWIIDKRGFNSVELDIAGDDLQAKVEYLQRVIADKDYDMNAAAELFDILFAPLKSYIRHTNLIIVPHGVLHYLPFAALWDAENDRYLLQDYTITYAPSASALEFILDKRTPNQNRMLIMGNPDRTLPGAESEVVAVAELYQTKPLVRRQATESQVYSRSSQIDMLHLAAHGVYDPYNPLFTRIELAPDAVNDGNLEVHEIYGLDLSGANLVVLSACDTSKGQLTTGDELVGLTRAFLYAGAPTVVTTLWPIDDAASGALMVEFYRQLRAGLTSAEALRVAQLEVLAQDRWNSPYYWAAFGLTGDQK